MLLLKRLVVSNLFSFGSNNAPVVFGKGITTVIGVNQDEEGTHSNGVGKSSVLDAILFALFGEYSKKVKQAEIVRCGQTVGTAEVRIQTRTDLFDISRGISNGVASLAIKKNLVPLEFKGLSNGQALLMKELGMPESYGAENFLKSAYYSATSIEAFVSSDTGPTARMKMVMEAIGLDKVTAAVAAATSLFNKKSAEVSGINGIIHFIEGSLVDEKLLNVRADDWEVKIAKYRTEEEAYESGIQQIVDYVAMLNQVRVDKVRIEGEIQQSLTKLHSLEEKAKAVVQYEESVRQHKEKIRILKDELAGLNVNQSLYENACQQIQSVSDQIIKLTEQNKAMQANCEATRKRAEKAVNCPACQAALIVVDNGLSVYNGESREAVAKIVEEGANAIKEKAKKIGELTGEKIILEQHKRNQESVQKRATELTGKVSLLESMSIEKPVTVSEGELEEAKKSFQECLLQLKLVPQKYVDWKIDKFEAKLKEVAEKKKQIEELLMTVRGSLRVASSSLQDIRTRLKTNQENLDKLAMKSTERDAAIDEMCQARGASVLLDGFRRGLLSSFIPQFEARANSYLAEMGFGFVVFLELFREKADGEFKPELNIQVSDGAYKRSFNTYSEGEKTRIAIACQFALMDLSGNRYFDLIMLDEVLDTLDELGFKYVVPVCTKVAGSVIVTSRLMEHQVAASSNAIIKVTKRNGVSTLS